MTQGTASMCFRYILHLFHCEDWLDNTLPFVFLNSKVYGALWPKSRGLWEECREFFSCAMVILLSYSNVSLHQGGGGTTLSSWPTMIQRRRIHILCQEKDKNVYGEHDDNMCPHIVARINWISDSTQQKNLFTRSTYAHMITILIIGCSQFCDERKPRISRLWFCIEKKSL